MKNNNYHFSNTEAKQIVTLAKWKFFDILIKLGVQERYLITKWIKCPYCIATNRFMYCDKSGFGDGFCLCCGYHSGVEYIMKFKKWSFQETIAYLAEEVGWKPSEKKSEKIITDEDRKQESFIKNRYFNEEGKTYKYIGTTIQNGYGCSKNLLLSEGAIYNPDYKCYFFKNPHPLFDCEEVNFDDMYEFDDNGHFTTTDRFDLIFKHAMYE